MLNVSDYFKNLQANPERLLDFGFEKKQNNFSIQKPLADGQFILTITIQNNGTVETNVIDADSGEDYLLFYIDNVSGAFISRLRNEYEDFLEKIARYCFFQDSLLCNGIQSIINHIQQKYSISPEYLWEKFPDYAIFRRKDNAKWFAVFLTVDKVKLGLPGSGRAEIIDLRETPEEIKYLIDGRCYLPGYHMNKKHWLSICLDGSVTNENIFKHIEKSYALAAGKKSPAAAHKA